MPTARRRVTQELVRAVEDALCLLDGGLNLFDLPIRRLAQPTQGNEFRLTDLDGGGCRWRFWMCSEDLDPQRLYDPAPKCHCSVQEMLLGARWGASQSNPLT